MDCWGDFLHAESKLKSFERDSVVSEKCEFKRNR